MPIIFKQMFVKHTKLNANNNFIWRDKIMELTQKELDDITYIKSQRVQTAIDAMLDLEGDILTSEQIRSTLTILRNKDYELNQ